MKYIIDYLIQNRQLTLDMYERILIIQIILLLTVFLMIIFYDFSKRAAYKKSLIPGSLNYVYEYGDLKHIAKEMHSQRVSDICYAIAKAMRLPKRQQEEVRLAGLVHDTGKIGIPEEILNKQEKLTDEEWAIIREHSKIGYDILSSINRFKHIAPYILQHHERIDGNGYPNKIQGNKIELYSKIIAIADAYDAMTSDRPYRKAMSKEQSIAEIKNCSGTQFDSKIAKIFIENVLTQPV